MSSASDLRNIPTEVLERRLREAKALRDKQQTAERLQSLRAVVLAAIEAAPAESLPEILAFIQGNKRPPAQHPTPRPAPHRAAHKPVYRWDEHLKKNRLTDGNGNFVHPPVLMRGRYANIPLR